MSNLSIVDKTNNLPKCEQKNEGEEIWLKEEKHAIVCKNSIWTTLPKESFSFNCALIPIGGKNESTIKCNGDSLGIVKNGRNGSNGVDGTGCVIIDSDEKTATFECDSEKFTLPLNGKSIEDIWVIAGNGLIKDLSLSGFSQKGPFVKGADVMAFELANGKTLAQTGRGYGGAINSENGLFNLNVVSLASQYVVLRGYGYYMNEVTGSKSDGTISLNAITDLTERSKANINLLTHLEFFRVQELVSKKAIPLKEAKIQAEKEILDQFFIKIDKISNTEDMNIFQEGDNNAALLAISVMLQRDNDVATLTGELAALSNDIRDDGKWNSISAAEFKARIADWISDINLDEIRNNISQWDLGPVPAFEKYVYNFRDRMLGLGTCDSKSDGIITRDTNSWSTYYSPTYDYSGENDQKVRFICKNGNWRKASAFEADTYQLGDGSFPGRVEKESQYSCSNGKCVLTSGYFEYHGHLYKTIQILDHLWFMENLNYVPEEYADQSWCYDNVEENCKQYGRLYTFGAAVDSAAVLSEDGKNCGVGQDCSLPETIQGLCPKGWHIASSSEIADAFFFQRHSLEIKKAGKRDIHGVFSDLDQKAYWWTISSNNDLCIEVEQTSTASSYSSGCGATTSTSIRRRIGASIRCIQD